MKNRYKNIAAILLILIIGIILQKNYINEFPSHIHAWGQSDRYALALRFTENNLNIFKPETFVLNHQFPHDMKVPAKESITAVDFPIHDYIPAIFMKISGNKSPWIFRLYILLYSFVGLFFLFRLASILSGNFLKSITVTILAATSPVFVYYQAGFLPTIPSLSNTIIGIYLYTIYLKSQDEKHFNLSILFITLATLSRMTFAISLFAIFGYEFIRLIKKEVKLKPKIVTIIISVGSLLFFFFYNGYLREKYGSIFLNHFMPASSFQRLIEIIKTATDNWGRQYFSSIHYIVFVIFFGLLFIAIILKKTEVSGISKKILHLTLIILLGCFLFVFLMIRQFYAHDYYFLDTFFLPVILLITISLSILPIIKSRLSIYMMSGCTVILGILLITNAIKTQQSRRIDGSWDKTLSTINNFKDSEVYLDSLKIPHNAKILVIGAYAPNISFILMNRKGYAVLKLDRERIENSLTWDFDYIVMQKEFFLSDIYANYPEILVKTKKVWDNGKILICKLKTGEKPQELDEFLGLNEKTPVKEEMMNFETEYTTDWSNVLTTSDFSYSGDKTGILTTADEYGITFSTQHLPELKDKERMLYFQSWFFHDTIKNVKLVVTISLNDETIYYNTTDLQDLLKNMESWEKLSLMFKLPKVNSDHYKFGLYLWNVERSMLYFDNFGFKIY